MSIIDQYMPCVCGSGKKFKFCKCGANQYASEVEKILRLMEGDQDLSALDRVNGQLSKYPNAAWLYALKCNILLRLGEIKSFADVASRFHKLKPDNPLALIFCSISADSNGESLHAQSRYLLAGIAESSEGPPGPTGLAIDLLCKRLVDEDKDAFLGYWGLMQQPFAERSGAEPAIKSPFVHWYCKSPSKIIDPPDDAPWLERMDEVGALTSTCRYDQVEKKLLSILRDYPNQPSPLTHLLSAQIAQLDEAGAISTAKKLAQHASLDPETRGLFQVLAWEYESKALKVDDLTILGEIEFEDRFVDDCSKMPVLVYQNSDEAKHWAAELIQEEVPAKHVFEAFLKQTVNGYEIVSQCGTVAFFSRQTDKPPRVLVVMFGFPAYRELSNRLLEMLAITRRLDIHVNASRPYTEYLNRQISFQQADKKFETLEERESRLIEEFLNYPFEVLDGLTPQMAAENPAYRQTLTALVMHLEGSPMLAVRIQVYKEIYRRLNLAFPIRKASSGPGEGLRLSDSIDPFRIEIEHLPIDSRIQLYVFGSRFRLPCLILQLGPALLTEPKVLGSASLELQIRVDLVAVETDPESRLTHSERIIELCGKLEIPVGHAVMNHMQFLAQAGRDSEIREYLLSAMQRFPDDPQLVAITQRMMAYSAASAQGQRELGVETGENAAGPLLASTPGGLVLPGSDSSRSQSESKLWLPGT